MKFFRGQKLQPWLAPSIEMRPSPVHGRGLFAREPIAAGEPVIIWGGVIFTEADVNAGLTRPGSTAQIDEGVYLADERDELEAADYFLNHSCDPNLWLNDELTLTARRNIPAGEELTADYALWETDPRWTLSPCGCGAKSCRGTITGSDWQIKALQKKYRRHFTPYLNKLILKQRKTDQA